MRPQIWNIANIDMDTVASTFPCPAHGSLTHVHAAHKNVIVQGHLKDSLLKEFVSHYSSGVDPRPITC